MNIPKSWTFSSSEVASGFDDHVKAELPWYELATWAVATIARHYVPSNGLIYDIGASTGNISRALEDVVKNSGSRLVAIEKEQSMADKYIGRGELVVCDALDYDFQKYDFAVIFLTMMFMPIAKRKDWLMGMVSKINTGGAIVIFEKEEPKGGFISTAIYRMTLEAKLNAGVDPVNVIKKELSLGGFQRPITQYELPVRKTEIFRFGDFAGWLIEAQSCP